MHTKQVKSILTVQIHQLWLDFSYHTKCNELIIESTEYERPISCGHRQTRLCPWSILFVITGPESLAMFVSDSFTHSLTHSSLVNFIDVTLACEDAYSKLVEVVTHADVSVEDRVGNSLLQIWKLRFGLKA